MNRNIKLKLIILATLASLINPTPIFRVANAEVMRINHNYISAAATQLNDRSIEIKAQVAARRADVASRRDEIIVRFSNEAQFRRVKLATGEDIDEALSRYQTRGNVLYAEPNYIARKFEVPSDPLYGLQWHIQEAGSGGIAAANAWQVSRGENITVAVIDTGVAYENYRENSWNNYVRAPDFANTVFVAGYDFVNRDTHPNDDEGHGTHVAGTIAGSTNNNLGVASVAPGAKIMPIKVLDNRGSGTYADIAEGIIWATDQGAQVINLSLGGPVGTTYLRDALKYAHDRNVTIVAAAGNDGRGTVSYPAAYDDYVIAVGATRFDKNRAPYSNYGTALDVVAPGGDSSVDQNRDGYGDGVLQQTFGRRFDDFNYYFYQGTSMASPHVAGIAALILAINPSRTPAEVQNIIQSTAEDLGAPGRDNEYGWGLVNAERAVTANSTTPNSPSTGPVPPVSNDQPPTVEFITPLAGANVTDQINIRVVARDDVAVVKVDFLLDGSWITNDQTEPFEINFDSTTTADGPHTLRAIAFDSLNQTAEANISINVANSVTNPESAAGPIIFEDYFESNSLGSDWTGSSQMWSISSREAFEGQRALWLAGETHNEPLTSRLINLANTDRVEISFAWLITRSVDRDEYLAFDISTDRGASWQEQARIKGNDDPEDQWLTFRTTITNTETIQLRFRGELSRRREDGYVDAVKVVHLP